MIERNVLICKTYLQMLYLLMSHMKSDNILISPNIAKNDLFCLVFLVVCVVMHQKLCKKITVTARHLLICKTCV